MSITRRVFLRNSALAMVATTAVPSFLARAVYGAESGLRGKKKFVVIFQRGAADGLNIVVPHGERNYYSMRPTIAIPRPQNGVDAAAIDLDGFLDSIRQWPHLSRCRSRDIWPLCTPPAPPLKPPL